VAPQPPTTQVPNTAADNTLFSIQLLLQKAQEEVKAIQSVSDEATKSKEAMASAETEARQTLQDIGDHHNQAKTDRASVATLLVQAGTDTDKLGKLSERSVELEKTARTAMSNSLSNAAKAEADANKAEGPHINLLPDFRKKLGTLQSTVGQYDLAKTRYEQAKASSESAKGAADSATASMKLACGALKDAVREVRGQNAEASRAVEELREGAERAEASVEDAKIRRIRKLEEELAGIREETVSLLRTAKVDILNEMESQRDELDSSIESLRAHTSSSTSARDEILLATHDCILEMEEIIPDVASSAAYSTGLLRAAQHVTGKKFIADVLAKLALDIQVNQTCNNFRLEQAKTQLANIGTDHENLGTSINEFPTTVDSHTKGLLSRATISSVSRLKAEWEGVAPLEDRPGLCELLSDLKPKIKSVDHKLSQADIKIESKDDRLDIRLERVDTEKGSKREGTTKSLETQTNGSKASRTTFSGRSREPCEGQTLTDNETGLSHSKITTRQAWLSWSS
jgi:tetratricopeptide (TPR) repeat protein